MSEAVKKQVLDSLASLGETADAIADALANAGIVAMPRCWEDDPVCKWLLRRHDFTLAVRTQHEICVRHRELGFVIVGMPQSVLLFWELFNLSAYQDLIDPPRPLAPIDTVPETEAAAESARKPERAMPTAEWRTVDGGWKGET